MYICVRVSVGIGLGVAVGPLICDGTTTGTATDGTAVEDTVAAACVEGAAGVVGSTLADGVNSGPLVGTTAGCVGTFDTIVGLLVEAVAGAPPVFVTVISITRGSGVLVTCMTINVGC